MFAKTGKHLDHLQEGILRGTWQRQKYPEIAKTCYRSEAHVKKVASKLWKLLSETLGEDINQSNFRYTVERWKFSIVSSHFGDYAQVGKFSVCENKSHPSEIPNTEKPAQSIYNQTKPKERLDLSDAPEPNLFSNRTSELATFTQWIKDARTRAIAIYGLSGIGKSAIALKLIEQIQPEFDYIIWRSLSDAPTLSTLQTDLKQFFSRSQPTPLPTVIDYFRSFRCLVILDDVQNIFKIGQLAGQYLPGYEDYGKFFKQIATSSHQSCLILLSWEKPREIATLEAENRATRSLHLKGLGEQPGELLRDKKLTDEEKWSELITLYQGHPSWLNIIAATIIEFFNGSVSLFLAEQNSIFLGDIEPILDSHLERLSELEQKAIAWLASQDEAVDISQPGDRELSKTELWQALQSLGRRGLVEKMQVKGRSQFFLNPVFKQDIQSKLNPLSDQL